MQKDIRYRQAQELIGQQAYGQAIALLDALLSEEPVQAAAYYYRSVAYYRSEQLERALQDSDSALQHAPQEAEYYAHRAILRHMSGASQQALQDFDRAQALEPENPYRYASRAFVKAHLKDVQGAMDDYRKALDLDPEDAVSHNNLGLLEEQLGRARQAQEHFAKADALSGLTPKDPQPDHAPADDTAARIQAWKEQQEEKKRKSQRLQPPAEADAPVRPRFSVREYAHVIGQVFTDGSVFKEFVQFVRELLGGKRG